MYKFMKIKYFFITVFSFFIVINNSFSKECFEKSQRLIELKNDYYGLEPNGKISIKDRKLLNEFYSNIKGEWKGVIQYKICEGRERSPKLTLKKANATVEIKMATNYLLIKLKKSRNDYNIGSEKLKLLGDKGLLYFKFKSKNNLVFSEIIRKRNVNGGSRQMEQNYKFEFIKDGYKKKEDILNFSISHYLNGVFIGDEKWSMIRD